MDQFTSIETYYWIGILLSGKKEIEFRNYIEKTIFQKKINWHLLLRIADNNLVLPQVYSAFNNLKLLKSLPSDVAKELTEIYNLNNEKNLKILVQVEEITKLLNNHGIEPIFLKGVGNLIDGLYSSPGYRYIGDIDILVSNEEFLRVVQIMQSAAGYKTRSEFFKFNERGLYSMKHYPRLNHPDYLADVEIHKLMANPPFHDRFTYQTVQETLKKPKAFPGRYYVLSDGHKAIHNFIHSQLNDRAYFRANPSMRQMHDLILLSLRTDILQSFIQFGYYTNRANNYIALSQYVFKSENNILLKKNFLFKIYKFRFNSVIQSPQLLAFYEKTDNALKPLRHYTFNVLFRLFNDKEYRIINLYSLKQKLRLDQFLSNK